MHFGEELYRKALPYQLRIIEHLMSLGVQVIIGAHPHVLQQHCLHDNKLVAYSLGNFLFHPRRPMSGVNPVIPDTGQKNVQQNSSIWPCLLHYKPLKLFAQSLGRIILRGQCVSLSRGPSESRLFVSDTSPKCINREGLGRRCTGTRQSSYVDSEIHYIIKSKYGTENEW